jgi:hypothetical protein
MTGLAWDPGTPIDVELCSITTDHGTVRVSAHRTGNGMRLKLWSSRTGMSTLLDATVLDAMCSLSPEQIRQTVQADGRDRRPRRNRSAG